MHVTLATEFGEFLANPGRNDTNELTVAGTRAQAVPEAPALLAKQAVAKLAVRRQAQPVATAAEGVGHAGDDTEAAPPAWDGPEARYVVGGVGRQPLELSPASLPQVPMDGLEDVGLRNEAVGAPAVPVERHELQETYLHGQTLREVHESTDLVLVRTPKQHAVDLQGEEVLLCHLFQCINHSSVPGLWAACEHRELGSRERVQAEVHVPDARPPQLREKPLQPNTVGGQTD
mmetsp:Transcript_19818/g.62277  ORF Transcript_19818/g.62277 Transcript_19818/m.62277 type:complete len:232 (+) Transcript_19818:170-865(+)